MNSDAALLFALSLAASTLLPHTASAELPAPRNIEAAGASFPMIEAGEGAPVLFLHGTVGDYRAFEALWAATAKDHRAIAYTQRWFGTGDWPADQPFSPEVHAADLVAILETFGEPVNVVAWSYGADVALRAAAEAPELIRSLVLYEPPSWGVLSGEPEGEAAVGMLMEAFAEIDAAIEARDHPEAARELFETVNGLGEGGFATLKPQVQAMVLDSARTVEMLWNASAAPLLCDDLGAITPPTLMVAGSETWPAFALTTKAIADCIPAAELAEIEGVGHDGPVNPKVDLAARMLEFVDRQ